MNRQTLSLRPRAALAALLFAAALIPAFSVTPARAGANETPGKAYRPHAFGAYLANQWEFGSKDLAIFQEIVVGSQHYTQGAVYSDNDNGIGTGSAGVGNFFTFCTNRAHDVMLVAAHGGKAPARTFIGVWPKTVAGKAARDSVLTYWNGIFAAGSLSSLNGTTGYYIAATQTFYTTYFQTPQALCWWATCHSSLLSMTGAAEARDYLGYDEVVTSAKCNCDQRKVLQRMDGQEGQALRPLKAALGGINALCVDPKAKLVHKGAGNTTLSPSVLDHEPKGTVCEETAGFVYFDTSLDVRVDPKTVVVAFGDGFLKDHQWVGDDKITFVVVPTAPCPTILYDVIESKAISKADLARLDGNLVKPVNALGPNQDDYIWWTTCPCWPWIPWYTPDNVFVPDECAGVDTELYAVVTNNQMTDGIVNVTLEISGILAPTMVTHPIPAGGAALCSWEIQIPPTALEGQTFPLTLTLDDGINPPYLTNDVIVVKGPIRAQIADGYILKPGQLNRLHVDIEAPLDSFFDIYTTITLDQPWMVTPNPLGPIDIDPLTPHRLEFQIDVPAGALPGQKVQASAHFSGPGFSSLVFLDELTVGLPVLVGPQPPIDVVPGNNNGQIPIELVSLSLTSCNPIYVGHSTHGFPLNFALPSVLDPLLPAMGTISINVPPDPILVGQTGSIELTIRDENGNESLHSIPYTIEPAIEVITTDPTTYTGHAVPTLFPWQIRLRNRADVPLQGQVMANGGPAPCFPPMASFNLPPNAMSLHNFSLQMLPDLPAGTHPAMVLVQNNQQIGTQQRAYHHRIDHPVMPDLFDRAHAGNTGDVIILKALLKNVRTDHGMSGLYHFSDTMSWIIGPSSGTYELGPGESDSVEVQVQLGGFGRSVEEDSLVLTVEQIYDSGTPVEAKTWIILGALSVADTPDPLGAIEIESPVIAPNPFRPSTQISFSLLQAGHARLSVHDATGRKIALLADEGFTAGSHRVGWDGRGGNGEALPAGVYFVRVQTPGQTWTRKAVRLE